MADDDETDVFSDSRSEIDLDEDDDETEENGSKKRRLNESAEGDELQRLKANMKTMKKTIKSLVDEMKNMAATIEKLQAQEKEEKEERLKVEKSVENVAKEVEMIKKSDKAVKEQNEEVKKDAESYNTRMQDIEEKCIDLEGRGRRNNLIFLGVKEEENEDCREVALSVIKDGCKVTESVPIERAHRIGKSRRGMIGKKANEPRPLIVLFQRYVDRQTVKKCAKANLTGGQYCKEDLPFAVREARKKLSAQFEAAKKDSTVTDVYIAYPAKLFVNGELITSINPATGEPYASRARVQQRPRQDEHYPEGEFNEARIRRGGRGGYRGNDWRASDERGRGAGWGRGAHGGYGARGSRGYRGY